MRSPTRHVSKGGEVTWKVRFRYGGKQTSATLGTEAEASRFARILDATDAQTALDDLYRADAAYDVPTMDQLAADHIRLLTNVTDGTRLNYERLWARTWGRLFGSVPANLLTRDRVAEATIKLARDYSAKSLKNQRGLLAAVCDRAVDLGHLTANPTKRLRIPRGKETERPDMRILTTDETTALIDHAHEHYRPLLRFLASTGCRWGEAVALTVGDLELKGSRPTVRIRRALQWSPDNKREVGVTKTARSNRALPIPAPFVPELADVVGGRAKTELVFTAPRGGPVHHRTFWSDVWLPAIQAAEIPAPRPRIHDLRHSYAALLLGQGVPIHVVQRLMGHESIKTTVDTYGGLLPDALTAAADAAALAFVRGTAAGPGVRGIDG